MIVKVGVRARRLGSGTRRTVGPAAPNRPLLPRSAHAHVDERTGAIGGVLTSTLLTLLLLPLIYEWSEARAATKRSAGEAPDEPTVDAQPTKETP